MTCKYWLQIKVCSCIVPSKCAAANNILLDKKIFKKLTLAEILCWTFRQLCCLLQQRIKKMQMSNSVFMVHDVC